MGDRDREIVEDDRAPADKRMSRDPYKVFVSSTLCDNRERRKLVQDAINKAGMLWIGMEQFDASTRQTVEECERLVREADLFVGIIAWRYGWVPDGKDRSITEMEYDAAEERLMFLIDPSLPANIEEDFDPLPGRWAKQTRLEAFKEKFSKDQMPAIFDENTLKSTVLSSLIAWRDKRQQSSSSLSLSLPPAAAEPVPSLADEIRAYRGNAESLHENLPVAGFVTQLKVPVDIEEIYVPLRAMVDLRGISEGRFADSTDAEKKLLGDENSFEITLPEAFRQSEKRMRRGIVILGDPGSGKTTHLKRLLLWCIRKGSDTLGLAGGMVPVYLPLRELTDPAVGLAGFVQQQLSSRHLKTREGFAERMLERGNLLFLLDGLDEVADLSQRTEVSRWITEALKDYPTCRFVVSCRFAGYDGGAEFGGEFLEMHIRPLTRDQAEDFVRKWYAIVERGLARNPEQAGGIAREKADLLISRMREPDFLTRNVFELTRNPLLLTNICLVHRHRGGLPRKRARLYEECIDILLEHWQSAKQNRSTKAKKPRLSFSAQEGRRLLQPAAFWLHSEEGRTRASAAELVPCMEPDLKAVKWSGGSAARFLAAVRDESGLLTGWDQENYGFMHLGFQEYLAAREIRNRYFKEPAVLVALAARFGESWWQEVALLLLALEEPSLFEPYMREVVKHPAFAEHADLVEICIDDAAETSTVPFVDLLETDPGKDEELWARQLAGFRILERMDPDALNGLKRKLANHPSPEIRSLVGGRAEAMAHETGAAERGGYELVKIPGGTFMMGSPEEEDGRDDDEGPQRMVIVPEFHMGRYPVMNREYALFLAENPDTGEPEYWGDRKFNQPDQPVVGVSWEDAGLYARWAGLRLPSEAEWEYACRAGMTTRFYSGDLEEDLDRVGWYGKNSGGATKPVGGKEPNDFGLYDMHGNVWEWVEDDWHDNYKGAPADGSAWIGKPKRGADRVFRGGSWGFVPACCRSAFRGYSSPGYRIHLLGFRLSRSVVALGS